MKTYKQLIEGMKSGEFGLKGTPQRDKVKMMRQFTSAQNRIAKAAKEGRAPSAKDMALVNGGTVEQWETTIAKKYPDSKVTK
jgi:hypothetical protein